MFRHSKNTILVAGLLLLALQLWAMMVQNTRTTVLRWTLLQLLVPAAFIETVMVQLEFFPTRSTSTTRTDFKPLVW